MSKKQIINALITCLLFSSIFSQISVRDLDRLSNSQLDTLKETLQSKTEDSDLDLNSDELKDPIETDLNNNVSFEIDKNMTEISSDSIYFGYNYFKRDINFFDNIPTPSDFRLGPGDEIILSLWGETNLRERFNINKDGMIYYSNIGFINISNKTLKEAELLLIEELSKIYSTLKDKSNSTKLMLELGSLKSINIYFSGHIENPGINLIHPFSDVFSAIIQSGGINDNGSLRGVQLIRNNQIITTVDFYSFFMGGINTFSNIKLIDGDVIHIPSVKKRVMISGEVNRPLTYELLPYESILDIVSYASGFTSSASSTLILTQIIPLEKRLSDDNARTTATFNFRNKESIILNDGDIIEVPSIPPVDSEVDIFGRVKFPGKYPGVNTTLKTILDIAGGFDDPIFRKTIREDEILVLRQDSNKFYSTEILVSYKDANQFNLEPNDKIFIYENINYKNNFTYRVEGEVFKPGTYPITSSDLTVGEAISLAGGLTELSSIRNLTVKQEFTEVDEQGNEVISSEPVNDVNLDFKIGINSVIIASPFENVVRVEGNVYNPGLITFRKGAKLSKYIELAGGYMPDSIKNEVYIKRANGNIEKANTFLSIFGRRLYPGDTIVVPLDEDPSEFDTTKFLSDLSSTLANIAAILVVVNQSK